MPEVDLITIVKMVSKLVPRVELMRVVVVVGEVLKPKQKKKQWEHIKEITRLLMSSSIRRNLSFRVNMDASFLLIEASWLDIYA